MCNNANSQNSTTLNENNNTKLVYQVLFNQNRNYFQKDDLTLELRALQTLLIYLRNIINFVEEIF